MAPNKKFLHYRLAQCRFLIYQWISLSSNFPHAWFSSVKPQFFFFIHKCCYLFDLSLCKSHFIQSISLSSLTNIDSCFDPYDFYLFCCTFSVFKAYYFSISMLWYRFWSIGVSLFNHPFLSYLHQVLDSADWEQPMAFTSLHCGLPS